MEENLMMNKAETADTEFWSEEEYRKLPTLNGAEPVELAREIARILDNKRGRDIKVLHVEDKTEIADYFVLCTANSNTHIKSLVGEVEYRMGLRGVDSHRVEGRDNGTWVIADYYHVIVHVFSRDAREFYNLDKLYGDAPEAATEI
jgi:ribosome-associated protein